MKRLIRISLLVAAIFACPPLAFPRQDAGTAPPPSDRETERQAERESKEAARRRKQEEKEEARRVQERAGVRCARLRRKQ